MPTFELKMPKLGESVTEGTIGKWLKQPGDRVAKYDLLVEVQTDKVNTEIPSPVAGTLLDVRVKEGDTVPIGALLAVFETADGEAAATATAAPTTVAPPVATAPMPAAAVTAPSRGAAPAERAVAAGPDVRATPAVRKLAVEHGVDLAAIEGTGLGGRVTRQDIEGFVASRGRAVERPAAATPAPSAPPRTPLAGDELVPLSQMRKAIANAMVHSKTTIPHAAAMMEVDWTNVARLRDKLKDGFRAREGFELTYLPFAMKAVCQALKDHPLVNATWTDRGVIKLKAINLGVAIALGDEGLVVPVLKNADALSISGLAKGVHDLATRARARKLTVADFEGGTFTINNGGTFGTYLSYPIVNPPQAAIMTTEAIGKRVVVLEGDAIAIRMMGNLVISFDHRVMDGATAARFLKQVKEWIQDVSDSVPVR